MMNKTALYIPRPGARASMVQQGYVDALEYLGWTVYQCDPKSKLGCQRLIEEYGVRLIMTHSRYGIRQLPIQVINANQVTVVVEVLPLNTSNLTVDSPYELAHDDEPNLIKEIDNVVIHTHVESHLWLKLMSGWNDILHLLMAANLTKAMPPTCSVLTDVAMVANFEHRQGIMKHLIEPLFKRVDLLGYSYQAFGDNIWQRAGLNCNGPLPLDSDKLAYIYSSAKVCPNVHTEAQIGLQAFLNERSFTIPLCGGLQVSDNPLATKYLGSYCAVATSTTDFMNKVINLIENQSSRYDKIRAGVRNIAQNHTYFNRLVKIFEKAGLPDHKEEASQKGTRLAIRHCWEIDARISAEERGIPYEN
ncbi:hypothetical protein LCGC14_0140980 [marine sediment metagenome]|uniref:Spore protein YkvP/CgeB glycosyl transferase-like domain-containing protein n=1 Tax=marine sediment metagenome TaxID=412755 RepID=A0A0F9VGA8_9ZZZZ